MPKGTAAGREPAQSIKYFVHAQLALGTVLVALVFLLGQALFDARTGLLAALIAAIYPELVAYSHFLWSETLFAVLLVAGLVAVWYAEARGSRPLALLGGAAFGLAALTREIAIPVAGVCAAWGVATARCGDRRAALLRAALLMAAMAVTILPWTIATIASSTASSPCPPWAGTRSRNPTSSIRRTGSTRSRTGQSSSAGATSPSGTSCR
jgi:4-amino-4-deoxy-L-arabinose transferase-like glycosyltransferase